METSLGTIFLSEFVGTAMLILLGVGVVANNLLAKTKGNSFGFMAVNWGWGLAVMFGVIAAYKTGGHLNPAVTFGVMASGATEYVAGAIPITAMTTLMYVLGQFAGGFVGAVLAWATYKQHYDADVDPAFKRGTFATAPEIRNPFWNTLTEAIGTFVLVFVVLISGKFTGQNPTPAANLGWLGALGVGLLIVAIGLSLGGPTGYAINPARDLSPRIAHAVLPIKGKTDSDWGYSWVPVVGPMIGGVVAGFVASFMPM